MLFISSTLYLNMTGKVLVTGGAGFIGSHTAIELIQEGYEIVIIDNLINSHKECIVRIEKLSGKNIQFHEVDLNEKTKLLQIFKMHDFEHVIHLAGHKAVAVSCQNPLEYYKNNVKGTITLLEVMAEVGVYSLVFSSSCTVYGQPQYLPLDEQHPTGFCTNPYGRTKYFIEEMLHDLTREQKNWRVVSLRYFNPIGAHKSGTIGEDPQGTPTNLLPFISQVAIGRLPHVDVFGDKYETPDGTCVRDYIHVVDLAKGHVAALKVLYKDSQYKVFNLGTGNPYSVLDIIHAFEKVLGKKIPHKIAPARSGDVACLYANTKLAEEQLGWKAQHGLDEMCEDVWRWQSQNPHGFLSGNL